MGLNALLNYNGSTRPKLEMLAFLFYGEFVKNQLVHTYTSDVLLDV